MKSTQNFECSPDDYNARRPRVLLYDYMINSQIHAGRGHDVSRLQPILKLYKRSPRTKRRFTARACDEIKSQLINSAKVSGEEENSSGKF